MNSMRKVSIIFPIYNNEKFLKKCVQSVIDQTLKDIELILIDDGSTDSASEIIDEFAEQDDRIRVVHKKNEGSAAGRNLGLDMAQGEYVAFVESDDSVAPDMYEKLYERAKETDADIVKCGFYFCTRRGREENKSFYGIAKDGEIFEAKDRPRIFQFHASIWAGVYKRAFIEDNKLRFLVTPKASYSDFSWRTETFSRAKRMTILHEPLYFYTFDNEGSSYLKAGELYQYKLFHAKASVQILRDEGIFERVKEEIAVDIYVNCIDGAYNVQSECRVDCFDGLYELFVDIFQGDFQYKNFGNRERYLIELVINHDFERFYDRLYEEYFMYDADDFVEKKIVLFGAGRCGRSYEKQLRKRGILIVKWIDNNPRPYLGVEPIDSIMEVEFDLVLIAVVDRSVFEEMKNQIHSMGVPNEKIIWKLPMRVC